MIYRLGDEAARSDRGVREALGLGQRFGTPLYVYQLEEIRRAVATLRSWLPADARLYYSLKANPHWRLVQVMAELDVGAEISSPGEMSAALRAGVPVSRCLYTGPGKTESEMEHALAEGIRLFSVESKVDLSRLVTCARAIGVDCQALLRLNGGARHGVGGSLRMAAQASQFGFDVTDPQSLKDLPLSSGGVEIVGTHTFAASNIADEAQLLSSFALNLATAAQVCSMLGVHPRLVDIGGGFHAPFATAGQNAQYPNLRHELKPLVENAPWVNGFVPAVGFESGRYLVGAAGTLVSRVMDIKDCGGKTFVVLDSGVNVLGGMSGLGRLIAPGAELLHARDPADCARFEEVSVVGPLCTPLDVLTRVRDAVVPPVGSLMAIPNVGAYGLTASLLAFLGRPIATEVVLDGERVVHVRRLTLQEETGDGQ